MGTARKTQTLPTLPGISEEARKQIHDLAQTIQRLESRTGVLESSGFLTKMEADQKYSAPAISRELASDGSAPLNVVVVGSRTILQSQPMSKGKR